MLGLELENLTQKGIILTPNERLSRRLQQVYGEKQLAKGHKVWNTPPIFSLQHWLTLCYRTMIEQGQLSAILLTPWQYSLLWQKTLKQINQKISADILDIYQTAQQMLSAQQILKQWRVNLNSLDFQQTVESRLFVACAQQINKILQQNNSLIQEDIPEVVLTWVISNYPCITLFGFDEITPQMQYFFTQLEQNGCQIEELDSQKTVEKQQLYIAATPEQQYYAMAQWAKSEYEAGKQQIACIIPELTSVRPTLIRIFSEVFYPEQLLQVHPANLIFNISGGSALITLPMILTVFDILALFEQEIDYNIVSRVLLSPFIHAAETEQLLRVNADMQLRNRVFQRIYNHTLPPSELALAPEFQRCWLSFTAHQPHKTSLFPSGWCAWLTEVLLTWGWPGERILNSQEYQQLQQWQALLTEITTLDDVCGSISFSAYLNLLKQLGSNTLFQAKTANTPIQILGVLEAAGNIYDSIWIADLTDKSWPPPAQPNPYIPFHLQRQLNMPHASSQRQYMYSERLLQHWLRSTSTLCFSYPAAIGDEPYHPSPLLLSLNITPVLLDAQMWELPQYIANSTHTEIYNETVILPFKPSDTQFYNTSLFEQQVNCPFQAFATQRLHNKEFITPNSPWDARQRGIHLHAVMEILWKTWRHSTILQELNDKELSTQIRLAVEKVLHTRLINHGLTAQSWIVKLEKQRLIMIITQWLKLEKNRPAFAVMQVEYRQQTQMANLNLRFSIDRIDQTVDQHIILIDYKSSTQKVNDWFTTPPIKPQLLLYACMLDPKPDAIVYAALHPAENKMKFDGVAKEDDILYSIKTYQEHKKVSASSWEGLYELWYNQLTTIAENFIAGHSHIQPRHPNVCLNCHLTSLCRIQS